MKALFFTYVWPEPSSSAAGVRTLELMVALQRHGWQVEALSPCRDNSFRAALEARGIRCHEQGPNDSAADALLRSINPDLAVFDRFVMEEQFGWRVRENCPGAAQVVDTQDLHFVRRTRERALKSGASLEAIEKFTGLEGGEDMVRELSSLYRADMALVVSTWEQELLKQHGVEAQWMPLFASEDGISAGARDGFCFLGNFRHPPNLDGILWLARELWDKSLGSLHLYGAYPPAEISALDGKENVRVHGPVADHRAALRKHKALLAPLRYGAGIKGKVLEAWMTSTPVIGTPIAFEGMGGGGWLQFRDKKEFREALARLPEEDWGSVGLNHAKAFFHGHDSRWAQSMEGLLKNLPALRKRNLVGRLLTHAQANSTKYFSRWIEEKEKRI